MFGGSIRFSTAALRSGEYPKSSSYPAHLRNRGKVEWRTTTLTQGADLKTKYEDLRAAGKPAKLAIVAIMRKLIEMANALVKADRLWVKKRA